jgi:hypothetical protein
MNPKRPTTSIQKTASETLLPNEVVAENLRLTCDHRGRELDVRGHQNHHTLRPHDSPALTPEAIESRNPIKRSSRLS